MKPQPDVTRVSRSQLRKVLEELAATKAMLQQLRHQVEAATALASTKVVNHDANKKLSINLGKLLEACKLPQCACTVAERDSGHRTECWWPEFHNVVGEVWEETQ